MRLIYRTGSVFALLASLLFLFAGCVSVPDEKNMVAIRSKRADVLLHNSSSVSTETCSILISGELSLAAAIEKAMERNLVLQQTRQEIEIARGRINESYSEALPSVAFSGRYTKFDEELGSIREGAYTTTRFENQYGAEAKLTQPLFTGRMNAALRAARLYRFWAGMVVRQEEENVAFQVIAAYYKAVLSAHLLEVNLVSLETAERQYADTKARKRQGMASNYDELRAEVEVSNFRAQVLQSRDNKDVAMTALFRLIGASAESEVELVDSIPLVPEEISVEAALKSALERRADLVEAEYSVRMQKESVESAKSRYYPEISGFFLQKWSNPDPRDSGRDEWGDEWQAGLQATWSLFDGLGRRGVMIRETAKLKQAELKLKDLEAGVISEIRQMVMSLKTAEEFANSQSRNLITAQEALRLVETGLGEGQNTPVEVMDARQALTTASANYYQSLYNHALARVSLQKAMGLMNLRGLPDAPVLVLTDSDNKNETRAGDVNE